MEDNKDKDISRSEAEKENAKSSEESIASTPESFIEDLKSKLEESEKKYLYLRAEFDNFRRQSIKERSELVKFAGERLAKDLLDTIDIFETALSTNVTSSNFDEFLKGIKLTHQQMKSALEKHSIVGVDSLGAAFDPNLHEALGMEPTDDFEEGTISKVFKKPYKYHDKILRPGQVILAKAKQSK